MAENINDISIEYEEDGQVIIEELEKVMLTRGAWTSILFRYRERDRKTNQFGPSKATLRRYQKYQGVFKKRDAINLSLDSAKILINTLTEWIDDGRLGDTSGPSEE